MSENKVLPKLKNPMVNRIVGHGVMPVDQMLANPKNWRIHPADQQLALAGAIDEIGYIRSVTVNQRTGNLVDGHLRVILADRSGVKELPVEFVDLSEADEATALATLDPIAAMAQADREKLEALLDSLATDDQRVKELAQDLADDHGLVIGDQVKDFSGLDQQLDELDGMQDFDISVVVPEQYKDQVIDWLANGELKTAAGLGKGVLKRCGLL